MVGRVVLLSIFAISARRLVGNATEDKHDEVGFASIRRRLWRLTFGWRSEHRAYWAVFSVRPSGLNVDIGLKMPWRHGAPSVRGGINRHVEDNARVLQERSGELA